MPYIFAPVPYFRAKIRREFTVNLTKHQGEYLNCMIVGVRMQRGLSIYLQAWIQDGYGAGAMFLLPIHAFVTKPCEMPDTNLIQPWDVFSPDFTVTRIELFYRSRAYLLPGHLPGRYLMTFDFTGNELADDLEQHKHLHLLAMDGGWLAAVPNNRCLIEDLAFLDHGVTKERPDFISLEPEYFAECGGSAALKQ
jgi:hypothetical protein